MFKNLPQTYMLSAVRKHDIMRQRSIHIRLLVTLPREFAGPLLYGNDGNEALSLAQC